ncbi:MAG: ATP-dependent DNA helicase RecG, partial [Alphaproteobacteria bacterium]
MRPEILYPLFKTLRTLPGIGPRNAKLVERIAGGRHVVDLLWHLPTGLIDRSFQPLVKDAPAGRIATLLVTIDKHLPAPNRRLPYKVLCSDHSGTAELVFFHAQPDWLEKTLPMGA